MRGALTVWLSDAALGAWQAPASGKPGGQCTYSDIAIEAALTIRMVFHLPLRQTEGCLRSLVNILEVEIPQSEELGGNCTWRSTQTPARSSPRI